MNKTLFENLTDFYGIENQNGEIMDFEKGTTTEEFCRKFSGALLGNPQALISMISNMGTRDLPPKEVVYWKPDGPKNIEFRPAIIGEKFLSYNREGDFIQIYRDGELISEELFRFGGVGGRWQDGFMILIHYFESTYEDKYSDEAKLRAKKKKPYLMKPCLDHLWCIIDESGKMIYETKEKFHHDLYQVASFIFVEKERYFDARTGHVYTENGRTKMVTDDYVFIEVWGSEGYGREKKPSTDGVHMIARRDTELLKEGQVFYFPKSRRN